MVEANAVAQALAEAFSGDALETAGANAAIERAATTILRVFMVVFLKGQKYQRPTIKIGSHHLAGKREFFSLGAFLLMCAVAATGAVAATRNIVHHATRQLRRIH
jgi:hypothetical protein